MTAGSLDRDERHEVVIQALHVLQHVHRMSIALDVVVPPSTGAYGAALRKLVRALRVTDAEFVDADRDGLSAVSLVHASCFVSACSVRPVRGVLDAIAAGVPTISTSHPSVAGSLALPPDAGPLLVAEAILAAIDGMWTAPAQASSDSSEAGA